MFPFYNRHIFRRGLESRKANGESQQLSPVETNGGKIPSVSSSLNSFGAKFQTTFVVCFSFFNKLSLEKKFVRKVERLNVKQRRSR